MKLSISGRSTLYRHHGVRPIVLLTVSRRLRCLGIVESGSCSTLAFAKRSRSSLIRFRGELTESDFAGLDRMAGDARGKSEFDCIFDFTAVERVDLATDFVAKRGELPQAFKDRERIYVVPQDDLKLLATWRRSMKPSAAWGWLKRISGPS